MIGQHQLPCEIVPGQQPTEHHAALLHDIVTHPQGQPPKQRRRPLRRRRVQGQRQRQPPRHQPERRVKPDVVHRPRHRLEADHRRPTLLQPLDPRPHRRLPDPSTLRLRPHREWSHPPLDTRPVHDVECRHLAALPPPQHRTGSRIVQRVPPDRWIEEWHPHPHHPIPAIPLRERVAEYPVERRDVLPPRHEWPVRLMLLAPGARDRHHAALSATIGRSSGDVGSGSPDASTCSVTAHPRSSSYRTVITRSIPSRTDSMCVIRITCSNRSCSRRKSSTTLCRRDSSSDPNTSSRISSENAWPARSAIICEIASLSTRFARSSSPPEITGFGNPSSSTMMLY